MVQKWVRPIKNGVKDEVRKLGARLGLPSDIINRHPFPGPGLAIRILCADSVPNTDDDTSGPSLKMLSNYSHCLKTPHKLLEKIKSSLTPFFRRDRTFVPKCRSEIIFFKQRVSYHFLNSRALK